VWSAPIAETAFVGESSVGDAPVVASEQTVNLLERLLEIIGDGSFPKRGERDHLTAAERRQLRDAMILEAHTRNDRDIFVTKDARGFIRYGRRAKLQRLCSTRIMTPDEFLAFCRNRADNS
jgi:hypothetical protein